VADGRRLKPSSGKLNSFSDASEEAYGACIFIKSRDSQNHCHVKLLCAKSRVAPLKTISLPRLELCAAFLLAQLYKNVISSLKMEIDNCYFWSDSMITLAWIRGDPHRWKTFVSNRVTQIQEIVDPERWYHIESSSSHNPADVISRCLNPDQLLSCQLWWEGPSFLMQSKQFWPNSKPDSLSEVPEAKEHYLVALKVNLSFELDLFERYSSLLKLQRITAYILRFIKNSKLPANDRTGLYFNRP
jgi:hypothetical protein